MLNNGQQLSDEHHVMRYAPWSKLLKDVDGNAIGLLWAAFEFRPDEDNLSVSWLEYYPGNHSERIAKCVQGFREGSYKVTSKSAFGFANVKKLKEATAGTGKAIRIVFTPSASNPAHTSIQKLPRDEFALFELLAIDVFAEFVKNSDIP